MKTRECSLTVRFPLETLTELKRRASSNFCSVSDLVRTIVFKSLSDGCEEYKFPSHERWEKAILSRDKYTCVNCRNGKNIAPHHIIPFSQGGQHILSNGKTLCKCCHNKAHASDSHLVETEDPRSSIPSAWRKLEIQCRRYEGDKRKFWEEKLALYMTRRRAPDSPVVQKYISDYLLVVDTATIIRTVIYLCPDPKTIKRPYAEQLKKGEVHIPPPFVCANQPRLHISGL